MPSSANVSLRLCAACLLAAGLAEAQAADLPVPAEVEVVTPALSPWSISMAPYFWGAELDGDIGLFGLPSVHVSQSFADIWDTLEFGAVGVDFKKRGRIMDRNLEILTRLLTEDKVRLKLDEFDLRDARVLPHPVQQPRPPILIGGYVDRVLKRAAVAGDGWLTYFYRPESFAKSWEKVRNFAREAGKDPDTLMNGAQLPIMIGKSRAAVETRMMEWLGKEWDYASWSDSTKDSAIMGTVDECVAQLKEHLAAGVQKLVFVPYQYEMGQIETIARDIIPRLRR